MFSMKRPAPPKAHQQQRQSNAAAALSSNATSSSRPVPSFQHCTDDAQPPPPQLALYDEPHLTQIEDHLEYETEEMEVGSTTTVVTTTCNDADLDYQPIHNYLLQQRHQQQLQGYQVDSRDESPVPKRPRYSTAECAAPPVVEPLADERTSTSNLLAGVLRHTAPQPLAEH